MATALLDVELLYGRSHLTSQNIECLTPPPKQGKACRQFPFATRNPNRFNLLMRMNLRKLAFPARPAFSV
jgi:hypothetical protein